MRQEQIEVFSTKGCRFCRQSKAKLVELGLPDFKNIDLDDVSGSLEDLDERTSERVRYALSSTVPQIYVSEDKVGGCDDLLAEIHSGEFFKRLKRADVEVGEARKSSEEGDGEEVSIESGEGLVSLSEGSDGKLILNGGGDNSNCDDKMSAFQLSRDLQSAALSLLDEFSTMDGSRVNYKRMRKSSQFRKFVELSGQFKGVSLDDLATLSSDQRFSMFTNIYNALIIHGTCVVDAPADTPESRTAFFSGTAGIAYEIGGLRFSADDIEHGILRANYRHPYATPAEQASFFTQGDPREALAVSTLDPRVHFVLNCGAKSCPPIKILPDDPEQALQAGARAYLVDNVSIRGSVGDDDDDGVAGEVVVVLPKLLLWYRADFGQTDSEVLSRVAEMLGAGSGLAAALATIVSGSRQVRIEYGEYDWGSNDSGA